MKFRLHSRFVLGRWRFFVNFRHFYSFFVPHHKAGWIDESFYTGSGKINYPPEGMFNYFIIE